MTAPYYADDAVTLYLGDCRDVIRTTGITADVLVTDPPYGYEYSSNWDSPWTGVAIAGDESTALRDAVLDWWRPRPALVFGSWKIPPPFGTRAVLAWDKGLAFGMGDLALPWKPNWEQIYVIGGGFSGRRDSGVITGHMVSWASKGRDHPNQKPLGLMAKLIDKCPAGTVLDPFAGSGSTLIAARDAGRRAIGIEVEERYCEVIARRLAQDCLPLEAL